MYLGVHALCYLQIFDLRANFPVFPKQQAHAALELFWGTLKTSFV
jgi:hypothetical protein